MVKKKRRLIAAMLLFAVTAMVEAITMMVLLVKPCAGFSSHFAITGAILSTSGFLTTYALYKKMGEIRLPWPKRHTYHG